VSATQTRLPLELSSRVVGALRPHPSDAELPLVVPRTSDELVTALRAAHRDRLALVPIGSGSRLAWTRAPERADLLLSVR
jgi:FAD/FMN-containing dehydrogenase